MPRQHRGSAISGFSGTARAAWLFARSLGPTAAGVIGFGAGLPAGWRAPTDGGFTFYGAAGFTDFNYQEMRQLDETLDESGNLDYILRRYCPPT